MEGDNLQVNSNPIKDCELVAALSCHVVQWLEYMGSSSQGLWVGFYLISLNMCLLELIEASHCKASKQNKLKHIPPCHPTYKA